ncbi:hypothetical protein RB7632 [Rhodopirellula baltica SH 1]|uniref:Uncharacterized protein n=1 Tax=Rhodopirellula baltica (strain DSM 10527 / NCIMB 13988 / SH1) TaxID=243090 RepID=Q7UND9_RHOBA|nr:hypothetical protein RB7632 [Rhodopirellula baltica SH 1]
MRYQPVAVANDQSEVRAQFMRVPLGTVTLSFARGDVPVVDCVLQKSNR